jgi:hypothetical protein
MIRCFHRILATGLVACLGANSSLASVREGLPARPFQIQNTRQSLFAQEAIVGELIDGIKVIFKDPKVKEIHWGPWLGPWRTAFPNASSNGRRWDFIEADPAFARPMLSALAGPEPSGWKPASNGVRFRGHRIPATFESLLKEFLPRVTFTHEELPDVGEIQITIPHDSALREALSELVRAATKQGIRVSDQGSEKTTFYLYMPFYQQLFPSSQYVRTLTKPKVSTSMGRSNGRVLDAVGMMSLLVVLTPFVWRMYPFSSWFITTTHTLVSWVSGFQPGVWLSLALVVAVVLPLKQITDWEKVRQFNQLARRVGMPVNLTLAEKDLFQWLQTLQTYGPRALALEFKNSEGLEIRAITLLINKLELIESVLQHLDEPWVIVLREAIQKALQERYWPDRPNASWSVNTILDRVLAKVTGEERRYVTSDNVRALLILMAGQPFNPVEISHDPTSHGFRYLRHVNGKQLHHWPSTGIRLSPIRLIHPQGMTEQAKRHLDAIENWSRVSYSGDVAEMILAAFNRAYDDYTPAELAAMSDEKEGWRTPKNPGLMDVLAQWGYLSPGFLSEEATVSRMRQDPVLKKEVQETIDSFVANARLMDLYPPTADVLNEGGHHRWLQRIIWSEQFEKAQSSITFILFMAMALLGVVVFLGPYILRALHLLMQVIPKKQSQIYSMDVPGFAFIFSFHSWSRHRDWLLKAA